MIYLLFQRKIIDYICYKDMKPHHRFCIYVMVACMIFLLSCRKDQETTLPVKPRPLTIAIPKGFPQLIIPEDNPLTEEGVELGRRLFYDPILSADNSQSCSSCHKQEASFSDPGKRFSKGIHGLEGHRNAQALINLGFNLHFFWDGRAKSLEKQALEPVPNPMEMDLKWSVAAERLKNHPYYKSQFEKAFGSVPIDSGYVAKALSQFMRTMISANSRFDRRMRNEISLTPSELNGYVIFNTEKGDCFHCHGFDGGRLLTDNRFHNNGLDSDFPDPGLANITGQESDRGKFLTPTLRNIALTAPYMHDGRFSTLEEVVEHYNKGGKPSPTIDPLMKHVGTGLNLTKQEKTDLIAFLKSLTDSTFITDKKFSAPF